MSEQDGMKQKPGKPTVVAELPFDRTEWEARLATARAQRKRVMEKRALARQMREAEAAANGGPTLVVADGAPVHQDPPKGRGATTLRAPVRETPAPSSEVPAEPSGPPPRPPVLWLAVGCVLGVLVAGLVFLGTGLSEPSRDAVALASPDTAPSPDTATIAAIADVPPVPDEMPVPVPDVAAAGPKRIVVEDVASHGPLETVSVTSKGATDRTAPEEIPVLASASPADDVLTDLSEPRPGRLVVQVPQNLAPQDREAALARLAQNDWTADATPTSPFTISETHVRFYHGADRPAAERLATLFAVELRDFTDFRPSPDEGFVELWLSGEGAQRNVAVTRQRPSRNVSQQAARDLAHSRAAIRRFVKEVTRAANR